MAALWDDNPWLMVLVSPWQQKYVFITAANGKYMKLIFGKCVFWRHNNSRNVNALETNRDLAS